MPQNGEWTFPKMATGDHEHPILLYYLYPKYQKLLQHASHIMQPNHHVPNTLGGTDLGYPAQPGLIGESACLSVCLSVLYSCVCVALIL